MASQPKCPNAPAPARDAPPRHHLLSVQSTQNRPELPPLVLEKGGSRRRSPSNPSDLKLVAKNRLSMWMTVTWLPVIFPLLTRASASACSLPSIHPSVSPLFRKPFSWTFLPKHSRRKLQPSLHPPIYLASFLQTILLELKTLEISWVLK